MGRRARKLRETVELRRRSENTEDTSFSKPDGQPSWLGTASSRTFSHDFSRVPTMSPLKHADGFARRNTRRCPVATEITMFAFQCERIEEKMQRNNTAYRKGSVCLSFSLILSLSLPRAVSLSLSRTGGQTRWPVCIGRRFAWFSVAENITRGELSLPGHSYSMYRSTGGHARARVTQVPTHRARV